MVQGHKCLCIHKTKIKSPLFFWKGHIKRTSSKAMPLSDNRGLANLFEMVKFELLF